MPLKPPFKLPYTILDVSLRLRRVEALFPLLQYVGVGEPASGIRTATTDHIGTSL